MQRKLLLEEELKIDLGITNIKRRASFASLPDKALKLHYQQQVESRVVATPLVVTLDREYLYNLRQEVSRNRTERDELFERVRHLEALLVETRHERQYLEGRMEQYQQQLVELHSKRVEPRAIAAPPPVIHDKYIEALNNLQLQHLNNEDTMNETTPEV